MAKRQTTQPRPPSHLSEASKAWWRTIVTEFALESHHLKILEAAAGAWDRIEEARKILQAEGLTTKDRFGQAKAHPAAIIERDSKALFSRLVRELGLDVQGPQDNRPPRVGGSRY